MHVAVLATNRNPLSVPYAGGQESLTAALVRGFRARGHRVTLYAASGTPGDLADELVTYPEVPALSVVAALDPQLPEKPFLADHHAFTFAVAELAGRRDVDVVANHSLHHLPLSMSRLLPAPVVTTLHTPPFPWMELGAALATSSARYVAVSDALARQWTTVAPQVVHNGVDTSVFALGVGSDDGDLVWAGRITPEKAPHLAVDAARRAGRRLRLVGPVADEDYARDVLRPRFSDGIEYLGPLAPAELATVMGESAALLMTPLWDEPFGLVAAEAAACGTPVVVLGRGGVAEVVRPGMGVVVPDGADGTDAARVAGIVEALEQVRSLDRGSVREIAVEHFGMGRCVDGHLAVFDAALAEERRA